MSQSQSQYRIPASYPPLDCQSATLVFGLTLGSVLRQSVNSRQRFSYNMIKTYKTATFCVETIKVVSQDY